MDSATFLLGVDYPPPSIGDWDLFVSAQVLQQRIFNVTVPLIFENRETTLTGLARLSRQDGVVEIELAGTLNVDRLAYLGAVRASYKPTDRWKLRASVVSIGGRPGSLLADFQALDLGVLELIYYW